MTLHLNGTDFGAGDTFHLYFELGNPGSEQMVSDVYLLLGVYGYFWCWPSWCDLQSDIDSKQMTVDPGSIVSEDVLNFVWPTETGSASGLYFYGAAFQAGSFDLIGDVQIIEWAYH